MKKFLKYSTISLTVVFTLIFIVFLLRFVYLQSTLEKNNLTYENQFITFEYPADYVIENKIVYDSHEKQDGLDYYGMTGLVFWHKDFPSEKIYFRTFNQLNTENPRSVETRLADDLKFFSDRDGKLSFTEIDNSGLKGSVFTEDESNLFFTFKRYKASLHTENYIHNLETISGGMSYYRFWHGLDMKKVNFFEVFVRSFEEKQ